MAFNRHFAILGAAAIAFVPTATMVYQAAGAAYSINGNSQIAFAPAATMLYSASGGGAHARRQRMFLDEI